MRKYIVGGWNRDRLMGIEPHDKDYVLVGCTPADIQKMLDAGYELKGKDFPVYIAPNGEEHALARTERKAGSGYTGFEVNVSGVTLEQDLARRDLTINAIAWDNVVKRYIDPYGGQKDIENKVLRHVSDAFAEDPLRVLRLARFGARFSTFKVHSSTLKLVKKMVSSGELNDLTPERVTVEFVKSSENKFSKFISYLNEFGALETILPGYVLNKSVLEGLKFIEENCTPIYSFDMLMTHLLRKQEFSADYCTGMLKLPGSTVRFIQKINKIESSVLKFRSLSALQMVDLFNVIAARSNGGEEYLVKLLEYFVLNRNIDSVQEGLIFQVYDAYRNTKIPDIQKMVQDGELKSEHIHEYLNSIRAKSISELFV